MVTVAYNEAMAQVQAQMQYSLRLSDKPSTNINVRMELRQGTMDGTVVWFQQINTTTDDDGTCVMLLDFGHSINWSNAPYFIVAIIDDKEIGGSILTAVPYSLCAASLDGFITEGELVGTWNAREYSEEDNSDGVQGWKEIFQFNEDGTGNYTYSSGGNESSCSILWFLRNGTLVVKYRNDYTEGDGGYYYSIFTYPILKISSTSFYKESHNGYTARYNKETE